MRPVALQVFDFSLDGVIGKEGTEFFDFCRDVPEDPAMEAWLLHSLDRAGVHIMGHVTYEEMALNFPESSDPTANIMNSGAKAVFSAHLRPPTGPSRRSAAATP
jgi:hypothetical protein